MAHLGMLFFEVQGDDFNHVFWISTKPKTQGAVKGGWLGRPGKKNNLATGSAGNSQKINNTAPEAKHDYRWWFHFFSSLFGGTDPIWLTNIFQLG